MKVEETTSSILAIHKANVDNYQNALDQVTLAFRKVKKAEEILKDISLNAYKKYKDMEISIEEHNKLIESITNITLEDKDDDNS